MRAAWFFGGLEREQIRNRRMILRVAEAVNVLEVNSRLIGGLPETQEMLDFCGQHNITWDIEMIRMDQINTACERLLKSDVKCRFVIDKASLG